ncbi:MAG: prepilin-type N-terminal cleavage/methylation domain-containing protein [Armatimonadetes bacterium]|nr:prepilin-type N-terminal cleavage/methylation domain-containing protein [Armatimonadota bacterium]
MGRRGFTLAELLLAMAIISVLAAILFPVFAASRQKALEVTCASNLRQAALAISCYADDYDGAYPAGTPRATDPRRPIYQATLPGTLSPYLGARSWGACPSLDQPRFYAENECLMPRPVNSWTRGARRVSTVGQVVDPSCVALLFDPMTRARRTTTPAPPATTTGIRPDQTSMLVLGSTITGCGLVTVAEEVVPVIWTEETSIVQGVELTSTGGCPCTGPLTAERVFSGTLYPRPHAGGFNVAYADGHVERVSGFPEDLVFYGG